MHYLFCSVVVCFINAYSDVSQFWPQVLAKELHDMDSSTRFFYNWAPCSANYARNVTPSSSAGPLTGIAL
jgi:hypothetical protein